MAPRQLECDAVRLHESCDQGLGVAPDRLAPASGARCGSSLAIRSHARSATATRPASRLPPRRIQLDGGLPLHVAAELLLDASLDRLEVCHPSSSWR